MPIRLNPPLVKAYRLEESDKKYRIPPEEPGTMIEVRQATQGEVEARERLYGMYNREMTPGGSMKITQDYTWSELIRLEVFLTLASCNIEDADGKPLFHFEGGRLKDKRAFEQAWVMLDPFVANEIHECVLDLNAMWNFPTTAVREEQNPTP